ncbi:Npt1/Npt2 family nucleotide transporter [Acidobacteriota bacterium]
MIPNIIQRLFDVRRGEGIRVLSLFVYIFLLIASLMIVKPLRSALFLVKMGNEKLPYVYVLVAIFSALVAFLYSRFAQRYRLNRLITVTMCIAIGSLVVFWFLIHFRYQGEWLLYTFYIWVAIFAVVATAQFWLLANVMFNAREARRLFSIIVAGAISGGIFGGYSANLLASRLGSENLIFICIAFLAACLFIMNMIWSQRPRTSLRSNRKRAENRRDLKKAESPLKLITQSRHLLYMTCIVGLGVVAANLADYQFQTIAYNVIPDENSLTAFFGFWMSTFSLISLGIQLFLTRKIIKNMGVIPSLFFLPIGLMIGAVAVFINPALWTAIIIKVSDGSLKHSINKQGTELLALPISPEIKSKTRPFIDVFIKNLAKGIGGVLILILGLSVGQLSLVIAILIVMWIFLIVLVKKEYIQSFRTAIEKRTIKIDQESLNLQDISVFQNYLTELDGKSERQILFVLDLVEDVKNEQLIPYMENLIRHPSDDIKSRILKMSAKFEELDVSATAKELIVHGNLALKIEAMCYLLNRSENKIQLFNEYLDHKDYQIQSAALRCLAKEWRHDKDIQNEVDLNKLLKEALVFASTPSKDEERRQFIKINAADTIRDAGDPDLYPFLHHLFVDESHNVVKAAVICAGHTRSEEFIPLLIAHLNTRHVRRYAREALAEYGEEITDILMKYMESPGEDKWVRLAIPKVLAMIESQKTVTHFLKNMGLAEVRVRSEVIKALNKLRNQFSDLKFDTRVTDARIHEESRYYTHLQTILQRQSDEDRSDPENTDPRAVSSEKLLQRALIEKLDNNLERIFRLLGLKYAPKDMLNAYFGIKSDKPHYRANSLEFLDNILDGSQKKILIPIVESTMEQVAIDEIRRLFGIEIPTKKECIQFILGGDDNWLKICTLHLIGETRNKEFTSAVNNLMNDPEPMIRETAEYCLVKFKGAN